MASPFKISALLLTFCVSISLTLPVRSQTCASQTFTNNNLYTHCLDLPTLSSYLHFTYDAANSTLSVAFFASPSKSSGWISWAINPKVPAMGGAQALVAFKDSKGVMSAKTYNISTSTPYLVEQSKLAFDVWDTRAEEESGVMRIFAKIKVPPELAAKGTLNQVWQVGSNVDAAKGVPTIHDMGAPNLNSKGTLDLNGGKSVSSGGLDSRTKRKNVSLFFFFRFCWKNNIFSVPFSGFWRFIFELGFFFFFLEKLVALEMKYLLCYCFFSLQIHGVLNAVSWGILFPLGIVIARYLRTFPSADPAWFYLHVFCQVSAYAIGVAGWATGIKLGSESKGVQFSLHRNIGIALFALATVQVINFLPSCVLLPIQVALFIHLKGEKRIEFGLCFHVELVDVFFLSCQNHGHGFWQCAELLMREIEWTWQKWYFWSSFSPMVFRIITHKTYEKKRVMNSELLACLNQFYFLLASSYNEN